MNVYVNLNNSHLNAGDEIGIFDGVYCVGSGRITDPGLRYISLVASADDPATVEKDGFTIGNTLWFKVWNKHMKQEFNMDDLEYLSGTTDNFERMGTAFINVRSAPVGMIDYNAAKAWLGDNYPNPFRQSTTIPFSVAEESLVDIAIYDVLGQRINTLVHATLPAGSYTTEWSGINDKGLKVLPGIYFIKMVSTGEIFVKSIEAQGD